LDDEFEILNISVKRTKTKRDECIGACVNIKISNISEAKYNYLVELCETNAIPPFDKWNKYQPSFNN